MDVTCPSCAARYTADEQKLRGKTARMRCRACDTVWLVAGPTSETKPAESKRAAVVKRGADREHRDLFASRPADLGSVKQTLRPPPPDSLLNGVAARNETSVLFTVDALRGNARMKTPDPEPSPISTAFQSDDDEGIIDLNALASSPPKVGMRAVAPLFSSEPPPAAFTADVSDSGPQSMQGGFRMGKRAIAGIAAAAVAVVLCAVGLSAAFKGEEPVARASAAMTMVAPPAITAAPAPPPPPAAPVATSSSDDDAKSPTVGTSGGKKAKNHSKAAPKASFSGTKVQSSGVPKSSNDTGVAKTVPKAADKCGCKGDFNCILRCTATGK